MKISTKGRYALRLMLDLAVHNTGEFITLKEVSERQGISVKYLEQIVIQLTRAGLLKSLRGSSGGYKLARTPAEYNIGSILRITEGSLAPITCLETDINDCVRVSTCATLNFWQGLSKVIANYVDNTTLDDLLQNHNSQISNNYEI